MKKIIVRENERALLFKNGKFVKAVSAGKYNTFGGKVFEILSLKAEIISAYASLATLNANPEFENQIAYTEVGDQELALHYIDGSFSGVLQPGKHAFWKDGGVHTFKIINTADPEVSPDIPEYIFAGMSSNVLIKIEVPEQVKARLYYNNRFVRLLESGTYRFWRNAVKVSFDMVDTRLKMMDIQGQEILTEDKVTVRVNFVLNYRITDCVKIMTEVDGYENQLYVATQLALREYVGGYKLDELLENKQQLSEFVLSRLKEQAESLFVEIRSAGVKDIILPGDIRDIMNTVLKAEKRAQANVITRREEVASTRSLLNTAKLMDENKTLYKLKELEYLERICENVGNINIGGGDVLASLRTILLSSASED